MRQMMVQATNTKISKEVHLRNHSSNTIKEEEVNNISSGNHLITEVPLMSLMAAVAAVAFRRSIIITINSIIRATTHNVIRWIASRINLLEVNNRICKCSSRTAVRARETISTEVSKIIPSKATKVATCTITAAVSLQHHFKVDLNLSVHGRSIQNSRVLMDRTTKVIAIKKIMVSNCE